MYYLKNILNKIGIDGAVGFTLMGRIIQASGGLILIALISLFLTKEEQGYYYTFGSIIAIQVFFELGLNSIITQYVAHETAHLQWTSSGLLQGSEENLSRLSSLLRFCLKIFGILSIILFFVLGIVGIFFFLRYNKENTSIHWMIPWILVSASTALMLFINPILAIIEGLGKVKEVAKIRAKQQTFNILTLTLVLALNGGLYALGAASLCSFLVLISSVYRIENRKILIFIYRRLKSWKVDYWKEIFPYQYRIALSWVSGYFIFQLFNPVLFATAGAVVAGQMGMTLSALNGISSLSMSWVNTKVPAFSSLIAKKAYQKLDQLFFMTLGQLSSVNILLVVSFIVLIVGLNQYKIPFAKRFLDIIPLVLLSLVTFVNQFVFSWATYLRCHKKEPFLINSVVCGILCATSTIVFGKFFGLMGIVIGYSIISIVIGFPWAYLIFRNKRAAWH